MTHIFRSTIEGKQHTQKLKFVNDNKRSPQNRDKCVLMLLGKLNEAIDTTTPRMRLLFYETSGSAAFADALDHVKSASKAGKVQKVMKSSKTSKENGRSVGEVPE